MSDCSQRSICDLRFSSSLPDCCMLRWRSSMVCQISTMPSPVAVFRVATVPKVHENSLFKGDVLYTTDGFEYYLSMHDYETARVDKVRAAVRGCPARDNGLWEFEPEHLDFVEYDYL